MPPFLSRTSRSDRSDDALAARIRAGDDRALEALYERYGNRLLAFCRGLLGTREDAEDVVQHVFTAAYRHLRQDDRPLQVKPWLYASARNGCLDVLRRRRQHVDLDEWAEPATDGLALAAEVERREDLRAVLADLARLPEDQRTALVLAELGDLSHEEIAAVLNVRTPKVKALVFQARTGLAARREARAASCPDVQLELAAATGGALRRGPLRRHLDQCPACAQFRSEVGRQRAALAAVLPVVPSPALLHAVLGGATAASGGAFAAGGGVAGVTAASGGAFAAGGGAVAAKVLVVAVAATGGYAGVAQVRAPDGPPPAERPALRAAPAVRPAVVPAAAPAVAAPAAARPAVAVAAPARRQARPVRASRPRPTKSGPPADRGTRAAPPARSPRRADVPRNPNAGGRPVTRPEHAGRAESKPRADAPTARKPKRAQLPAGARRPQRPARPSGRSERTAPARTGVSEKTSPRGRAGVDAPTLVP